MREIVQCFVFEFFWIILLVGVDELLQIHHIALILYIEDVSGRDNLPNVDRVFLKSTEFYLTVSFQISKQKLLIRQALMKLKLI